MKQFSNFEKAAIKRTAQNVDKFVTKKFKLAEQINKLQEEYSAVTKMQEEWEAPIVSMTGYTTEELVSKQEVILTAKDGKTTKTYKFVLKYPETVVPPVNNNPNESWMDNASEVELKEYAEDMVASQNIEEQKDNLPY